jgi:alanine racemase
MPRPIQATIHPEAFATTWNAHARRPRMRLWAVVKANAYGHGIERVFEACGRRRLCPAGPGRGRARAPSGLARPHPAAGRRVRARDLELCSRLGIWHAVHCDEQIDWLAAHKTQQPHRVFLKMNSGMNRLGFTPERFRAPMRA